jgi:hypothetical protein
MRRISDDRGRPWGLALGMSGARSAHSAAPTPHRSLRIVHSASFTSLGYTGMAMPGMPSERCLRHMFRVGYLRAASARLSLLKYLMTARATAPNREAYQKARAVLGLVCPCSGPVSDFPPRVGADARAEDTRQEASRGERSGSGPQAGGESLCQESHHSTINGWKRSRSSWSASRSSAAVQWEGWSVAP